MSGDGGGTGGEGHDRFPGAEQSGEVDRQNSFEKVEEEAEFSRRLADGAGDIGCSDVPGTDLANVDAVQFADQKAERNRPDEVSRHRNGEMPCVHKKPVFFRLKRRSSRVLVYPV